jgi:Phosphotransacetylase
MNVLERSLSACRAKQPRIVFPDSLDERVLRAAARLRDEGAARPILLGNPMELRLAAWKAGVSLCGVGCVNHLADETLQAHACEYVRLHAGGKKPVSEKDAVAMMRSPLAAGAMLLRLGRADIGVAGNLSSTADVLRAGLRVVGLSEGGKTVFGVFVMIAPDGERMFVFADCAVIPQPEAEQLADIAVGASAFWQRLTGAEARTAMLSFSTRGSAGHELAGKVRHAVECVRQRIPDVLVDGELQLDAALAPDVAALKAPGSPLEGAANVLVFPGLEAGNIGYKLLQRLGGYTALGPFLVGFARGWHDLSRGCSAEDIYEISLTAAAL